MADLRGVALKISRAREHLDAIDDQVVRFAGLDPYRVVAHFDDENAAYFADPPRPGYVGVLQQVVGLDTETLSLIVGDCVHNLRSALDHLAWQLVLAHSQGTPDRNTYFPIYDTPTTPAGKPRKIEVSGGVDPAALTIIKALQPYAASQTPALDPLAITHDLDRLDKHQTLRTVAAMVVNAQVYLGSTDENAGMVGQFVVGAFQHGAPVVYFPFAEDQGAVEVHGHLTARVTLADAPGQVAEEPITDLLDRLIRYVETEVVRPLAPFVV